MPSLYTFTEYSPEWPAAFAAEAERLHGLLGDTVVTIHHVGSTSIPGLAAKPIIDLLPIVRNIEDVGALTPKLEQAGYRAWGEYGLPGRRYFTKDREEYRTHNIHIYEADNIEVDRHLAFCAYLRAHPERCREYETLKREVYARHPADIQAYNDGKNDWIKAIEVEALAWYRACGSGPLGR
ncbi:MAG TPA: GrpB family protein [Caldilineaceae bacterium]|nr:GrpB family protein [Caldilineaceae bacterium]